MLELFEARIVRGSNSSKFELFEDRDVRSLNDHQTDPTSFTRQFLQFLRPSICENPQKRDERLIIQTILRKLLQPKTI